MSRIAKNPVTIPAGVELTLKGNHVSVKGAKGTLSMDMHTAVPLHKKTVRFRLALAMDRKSPALCPVLLAR
jgi:large subunit ribosomal protein L6